MKNILCVGLVCFIGAAMATASFGQQVTFDSSLTFDASDFTTGTNGVSTLALGSTSASNYEASLGYLGLTGSGWVFNIGSGTVVISNSAASWVKLSDPFVSFGYYFINTTGTTQNFSMQFTSNFSPLTFSTPSQANASFGFSLTDGTEDGTGVTASATQTGVLNQTDVDGNVLLSTPINVTLSSGPVSATTGGTTTDSSMTANFPSYVTGPTGGPYNQLAVDVSGTFSPGAILAVSGRVDLVPEPPTSALLLISGLAAVLFRLRRIGSV